MKTIKLAIEGMSCGHCVMHVTKALEALAGVSKVEVSLESNSAQVEADDSFDIQAATAAVQEAGYGASPY